VLAMFNPSWRALLTYPVAFTLIIRISFYLGQRFSSQSAFILVLDFGYKQDQDGVTFEALKSLSKTNVT
jgi:hypothetical protein